MTTAAVTVPPMALPAHRRDELRDEKFVLGSKSAGANHGHGRRIVLCASPRLTLGLQVAFARGRTKREYERRQGQADEACRPAVRQFGQTNPRGPSRACRDEACLALQGGIAGSPPRAEVGAHFGQTNPRAFRARSGSLAKQTQEVFPVFAGARHASPLQDGIAGSPVTLQFGQTNPREGIRGGRGQAVWPNEPKRSVPCL